MSLRENIRADRPVRGERLRKTGSTKLSVFARGLAISGGTRLAKNAIKKVLVDGARSAAKTAAKAAGKKIRMSEIMGIGLSPKWKMALNIGEMAANAINWGFQMRDIMAINAYDKTVKTDQNELMHYGIIGMRWGVRRTPEQLGHVTPHQDSLRARSKRASEMSDDELRTSINRVRAEKDYADLTMTDSERGKKEVSKILRSVPTILLTTAVGVTAKALVNKYITKKINDGSFVRSLSTLTAFVPGGSVDMSLRG